MIRILPDEHGIDRPYVCCAHCNKPIRSEADAIVEWNDANDARIVHKTNTCRIIDHDYDSSWPTFFGAWEAAWVLRTAQPPEWLGLIG